MSYFDTLHVAEGPEQGMQLAKKRKCRYIVLACIIVTLCVIGGVIGGICGAGLCSSGSSKNSTLTLSVKQSWVVMNSNNSEAVIEVLVYRDGALDESAEISLDFVSENSELISVSSTGVLSIVNNTYGSSMITVSADGAESPVSVVALIADLAPNTTLLSSEDLLEIEGGSSPTLTNLTQILAKIEQETFVVTLALNARTQDLEPGDIVVLPLMFLRVSSVVIDGQTVVLQATAATFEDAYENLVVSIAGLPVAWDGSEGDNLEQQRSIRIPPKLDCTASLGSLTGSVLPVVDPSISITPRFNIERVNKQLLKVEMFVEVKGEVDATLGEISFGSEATLTCTVASIGKLKPRFPLFGGVIFAFIEPELGASIELQSSKAAAKIFSGPRFKAEAAVKFGFGWSRGRGFYGIGDKTHKLTTSFEDKMESMTIKTEAYAKLDLELGIPLYFFDLSVKVASARPIVVGMETTTVAPFDDEAKEYTGPRWKNYLGVDAKLELSYDPGELFYAAGVKVKATGPVSFANLELLDLKLITFQKTSPTIEVSPSSINLDETASITVCDSQSQGGSIAVLAFRGSEPPSTVSTGSLSSSGCGTVQWTPTDSKFAGDLTMTARLIDLTIGSPFTSPLAPDDEVALKVIDPCGVPCYVGTMSGTWSGSGASGTWLGTFPGDSTVSFVSTDMFGNSYTYTGTVSSNNLFSVGNNDVMVTFTGEFTGTNPYQLSGTFQQTGGAVSGTFSGGSN